MRTVVKAKIIDENTTVYRNTTMQNFIDRCVAAGLIVEIKVTDAVSSGMVVVVAYKEIR